MVLVISAVKEFRKACLLLFAYRFAGIDMLGEILVLVAKRPRDARILLGKGPLEVFPL
jgi:hypothetical protein